MVSPKIPQKPSVISKREGWVYFIHAEGTNKVKIGRSIKPIERQAQLQKQSPHQLVLFRSFYSLDSITDEAKLHEQFAKYRVIGEWFDIFDQLTKFVEVEEMGEVGLLDCYYSHTYGQIYADTLEFFQGLDAKPTDSLRRAVGLFLSDCYPSKMVFFRYIKESMIPGLIKGTSSEPTSFIVGYLHAVAFWQDSVKGTH